MRRLHLYILGLVLLIGLFFRTYQVIDRFEFAHDGDLYSWMVKDIVVNHHLRLIGQLTSAPGIFIGPLFYYLLTPFFLLTKMDPIGALIPVTILGLLTILSYYFVLAKVFTKEVGLIGAFLYAVLLATVSSDRWVVPTVTTSIWAIWYFYVILMITRGNYFVFPFLGILVGLIWHVHIALVPSLVAIFVAMVISRKIPTRKQISLFFIFLATASLPLFIFELRHNFQQTISLMQNFTAPYAGPSGLDKFTHVLAMISQNTNTLLFAPQSFGLTQNIFFVILVLLSPLLLIKRKLLSLTDLIPLYSWVLGMVIFFSFTSSPISEYYFTNINVIFLAIVSLLAFYLYQSTFGKLLIFLLLALILSKNAYFLITENYYNKGYVERKSIVNYIKINAASKNYPCVGISYITTPGENVGFRYFFWLAKMHLVHPSREVPVYNIVIPDELSKEVNQKFGHIGLIVPAKIPPKNVIEKSCQTPDTNLTDSVFGYVE